MLLNASVFNEFSKIKNKQKNLAQCNWSALAKYPHILETQKTLPKKSGRKFVELAGSGKPQLPFTTNCMWQ